MKYGNTLYSNIFLGYFALYTSFITEDTLLSDSSVVHFASLLRTIFASLTCANERGHVHNVRDFPLARLESTGTVIEHGDLFFYFIIVYMLSS